MSSYTTSASDELRVKRRVAIRARWDRDREGLPHHLQQIVRRAHLLTPDKREQLVDRLAALDITTEAKKEADATLAA